MRLYLTVVDRFFLVLFCFFKINGYFKAKLNIVGAGLKDHLENY